MSDEPNDMGAAAMHDDSTVLQDAKVRHATYGGNVAPGPGDLPETTLADVAHIPPSGMTDEDVRRAERPNEFPRVRVIAHEPSIQGRHVGVVDEYGTVWAGEPGDSRVIGDLVPRDDETSTLYLRRKWWRR
jgi:hypothetical protein